MIAKEFKVFYSILLYVITHNNVCYVVTQYSYFILVCMITLIGGGAIIKALLQAEIKVNKGDKSQQTALMLAVQRADLEDIQAVLDGKADINLKDSLGRTALHLAAKRKHMYNF